MITFSKKYRSNQIEIMDDFQLQGAELERLLTDLKTVNKLLGGNSITKKGVSKLLRGLDADNPYTIIDLGCGDGEILRRLAKWGKQKGYHLKLIGLDANAYILKEAKLRSEGVKNITFSQVDLFSKENELPEFDIALCTLFLHHFSNKQINNLLNTLIDKAKVGIVINDLHRNWLAFYLFKLFSMVFLNTKIAKYDGQVSVARSFRKKEIEEFSQDLKGKHMLEWKWAFRWQWIIKTRNN